MVAADNRLGIFIGKIIKINFFDHRKCRDQEVNMIINSD